MKKYTLVVAALSALFFLSSPVYAESVIELCATEAKDAGIEDTAEFNTYVNECVEQMNTAAQSDQERNDAERSEVEKGVAETN